MDPICDESKQAGADNWKGSWNNRSLGDNVSAEVPGTVNLL